MSRTDDVHELIVRVLRGDATPQEGEHVRAWRDQSEQNERHFRELFDLWNAAAPHKLVYSQPPVATNLLSVPNRFGSQRHIRMPGWRAATGIAAALVGFLIAGGVWRAVTVPTTVHFTNEGAGSMVAQLTDGSLVELAPGSTVEFQMRRKTRRVELSGGAQFAVVTDRARQFVVNSGDVRVTVVGTRFELTSSSGRLTTLVVLEGAVRLDAPSGAYHLSVGDVARIDTVGTTHIVQEEQPIQHLMASRSMLFVDTPLRDATHEIGLRFGRRITIPDPALQDLRVTAWFTEEPFEDVMTALCAIAAAQCVPTSGQTTMTR